MDKKKRSAFGLVVAILVTFDAILMYSNVSNTVSSQTSGAASLGAALGASLIRPFLTCAFLSAVAALIGFFARWKWGYLVGTIVMIVGILQLPAIVGIPTEPAILTILLFVAFLIDHIKQKKQASEESASNANSSEE